MSHLSKYFSRYKGGLYSAIQPFDPDGFDEAFVIIRLVEGINPDPSLPAGRGMDEFVIAYIYAHVAIGPPRIEEDEVSLFKFISRYALSYVCLFLCRSGKADVKKFINLFYK